MIQTGGLEPLLKTPKFKYTLNEERKVFISSMYPYADYFMNAVRDIPWKLYTFAEETEYTFHNSKSMTTITESHREYKMCKNENYPTYVLLGGCAYEILNKKYRNINLHSYCDPTGDIDVSIYPPRLTTNYDGNNNDGKLLFFNKENTQINIFYRHFIDWTFNQYVENIKGFQRYLSEMFPNMVQFDIVDYTSIPTHHKTNAFCYKMVQIDKICIVAFLNEDKTMFKIQTVCKIVQDSVSVIDHVVELIIPLPSNDGVRGEFDLANELYDKNNELNFQKIDFQNRSSYNITHFASLVDANFMAYSARIESYEHDEHIHKAINHVARLFYLYELFYRNVEDFKQILKSASLTRMFGKTKKKFFLESYHYYKIVNNKFYKVDISIRFFENAYLKLTLLNPIVFNPYMMQNRTYFITADKLKNFNKEDYDNMQCVHDLFNRKLFDNDLFETTNNMMSDNLMSECLTQKNGGRLKKYGGKKTRMQRNKKTNRKTNRKTQICY